MENQVVDFKQELKFPLSYTKVAKRAKREKSCVVSWLDSKPSGSSVHIEAAVGVVNEIYPSKFGRFFLWKIYTFLRGIEVLNMKASGAHILVDRLRGLKVLDLACGCVNNPDSEECEPWLCRTLHELGAEVLGVDERYPNGKKGKDGEIERWPFLQLDLSKDGALDCLRTGNYDVINTCDFLGHTSGIRTSPGLKCWEGLEDPKYKAIEDEIFSQALRLLKPDGLFVINDEVYQKIGTGIIFTFNHRGNVYRPEKIRPNPNNVFVDTELLTDEISGKITH